MDSPVFVIGVPRSGTTLLRYMINSGGRIYIPQESHFIPRFFARHPHRPLTEEQIDAMLTTIRKDYPLFFRRWQGPELTGGQIVAARPSPTPADFVAEVFERYARGRGALSWGDKTPIYTNHMDLLNTLFPDSRFIHLIRDARDVALSTEDKWGDRAHVDLYYSVRSWRDRTLRVEQSTAALGPGRVHQLRYEDLIADPESHLTAICDFLGEPYDPRMAQPHLLGRRELRRTAFSAPIRRPPDPSKVAGWKQKMPEADQRLAQAVAGDTLARYGYELRPFPPLSRPLRGRLAAMRSKYEILQAGRRSLEAVGLAHPN